VEPLHKVKYGEYRTCNGGHKSAVDTGLKASAADLPHRRSGDHERGSAKDSAPISTSRRLARDNQSPATAISFTSVMVLKVSIVSIMSSSKSLTMMDTCFGWCCGGSPTEGVRAVSRLSRRTR